MFNTISRVLHDIMFKVGDTDKSPCRQKAPSSKNDMADNFTTRTKAPS